MKMKKRKKESRLLVPLTGRLLEAAQLSVITMQAEALLEQVVKELIRETIDEAPEKDYLFSFDEEMVDELAHSIVEQALAQIDERTKSELLKSIDASETAVKSGITVHGDL